MPRENSQMRLIWSHNAAFIYISNEARGRKMSISLCVGLIVSVALLVYLVYTFLRPDKF